MTTQDREQKADLEQIARSSGTSGVRRTETARPDAGRLTGLFPLRNLNERTVSLVATRAIRLAPSTEDHAPQTQPVIETGRLDSALRLGSETIVVESGEMPFIAPSSGEE